MTNSWSLRKVEVNREVRIATSNVLLIVLFLEKLQEGIIRTLVSVYKTFNKDLIDFYKEIHEYVVFRVSNINAFLQPCSVQNCVIMIFQIVI
jgi:hypothetical protein